jgi:hypothetical protein
MSTTYVVHIADAFGTPLTTVSNFVDADGPALDYVLSVGRVGVLQLTLPTSFNPDLLKLDGRIGVWRSINGRPPVLDGEAIYLMRVFEYTDLYTRVTAFHATSLLGRRIIAYAAGSAYASKAASPADDLIKTFANEQLGASISAANRDGVETQADVSAYLTVQVNLSLAADVAKAAARRNLLDVVWELCDASTTAGTYLAAEVVAPTEDTLKLRTYVTVRGVDHSISSGQPVILSRERGNLENVRLVADRSQEKTFIIAGGQGEGTLRQIETAVDATRMAESPFNRIEQFVDVSNVSDASQLQDAADAALRAARPIITFSADLVETPSTTRGIHFDLGDIVTAIHRNQQYDMRLDTLRVTVGQSERRTHVQLKSVT